MIFIYFCLCGVFMVVHRPLSVVASLDAEHRFQAHGSVVVVIVSKLWLSCCNGCEIFLDQGSNPSLLHWQVNW